MSENRPIAPAKPGTLLPAWWIGKPMNLLRFGTIVANLPGADGNKPS